MQAVRESCARVMEQARRVRIDGEGLMRFAARLRPEELRAAYRWAREYHLSAAPDQLVDYVFTLDALNFGSGFSPLWKARRSGTTYTAVAQALKQLHASGRELNAEFARCATAEEIARLLALEPDFPLVQMYVRSLNELGLWVTHCHASYRGLLQSLPRGGSAALLVRQLTDNLSCFDDRASYGTRDVCFYKRAQILVNDLHLALFNAQSPFEAPEIAALTCFADNLVPHVLRKEGVLFYDDQLLAQIERGEALPAGSPGEVEIRAAGVVAVERLVQALADLEPGGGVFPAMLDAYLWSVGQQQRYKAERRHLTPSFFY